MFLAFIRMIGLVACQRVETNYSADMKPNRFTWLLVLVLVVSGCNKPPATSAAKYDIAEIKAKAESGDAEAQLNYGGACLNGDGVAKDSAAAAKWFRKAADQKNILAQYNLGICFMNGQGVAKDAVEAAKWVRKAAEQNLPIAQFYLGAYYAYGEGVGKDDVEAVKWYRKAADQNYTPAQYYLGVCYVNGQGVEIDMAEAVKWYRKAADQNYNLAQYYLGVCYVNGQGVEKNMAEAAKWIQKAAEQNLPIAQYYLGTYYTFGQGVGKDDIEAAKWYRKAAEQDYAQAQFNLGICYQDGLGVPVDAVQKMKWFRKAAEHNLVEAQNNLADCYANGKGVPKDLVESYKWYNLASAQGNLVAKVWRDLIKNQMTADQIAEGQRRSSEFVPGQETSGLSSDNNILSDNPKATGTGFFITSDGYLISNYHVVKNAAKFRLQTEAGLIDVKVVKVDVANDLALLKASGKFTPLSIAASRTVKLGATVATVGFPSTGLQGFSPKLAKGEIASLSGAYDDPRYFQISVPVQPGNSGGALVDARGNVVGIVSAKLSAKAALDATGQLPENVNYAVKSSLLLSFLESVPDVAAKLKDPNTKDKAFEDVVKSAQDAAVLVLVY